jgi:heme-degrading monooxygenase HmoA
MIARMWRGLTLASKADDYFDYLEKTGLKDYRSIPGNQGVYVFRRLKEGAAEFLLVSFWDSVESIKQFAGDEHEKARYYPEDKDYLLELAPLVDHFEILAKPQ